LDWNVQVIRRSKPAETERKLDCLADLIQEFEPDLFSLQEVSARDVRDLGARLGLACRQVDYYQGANRGVAACTRRDSGWKITGWQPLRAVPNEDWWNGFAEVTRGDTTLNLMVVHLWPYRLQSDVLRPNFEVSELQRVAGLELIRRVRGFRDATIVAGDFNSPRDTAVHFSLRRAMTDAWEQAAWGPGASRHLGPFPMRVDFAYVLDLGVTTALAPETSCSDHRPLVVDLALGG
jgi:endonuclease/exonuclease/phosphatase family metal-dependent hydrolase